MNPTFNTHSNQLRKLIQSPRLLPGVVIWAWGSEGHSKQLDSDVRLSLT
jgi:hypothetical protein